MFGGPGAGRGAKKKRAEEDKDENEIKKIEKIYTENVNKLYKIIDKVFESPTPELVNKCLDNGTLAKFLDRLSDITKEPRRYKRTTQDYIDKQKKDEQDKLDKEKKLNEVKPDEVDEGK